MSNSSKRSRSARRAWQRAAAELRAGAAEFAASETHARTDRRDARADSAGAPQPTRPIAPARATSASDPSDAPTIILTPDEIARLSQASPPPTVPPAATDFAYNPQNDSPTIVLDVAALLATPVPPASPARAPLASGHPTTARAPLTSGTPTRKRNTGPLADPEEEFARLRGQRLEREEQGPSQPENELTARLRQWWRDVQPGIDRVLGRTHHGGTRGARATHGQTSAHLPAVKPRPTASAAPPATRHSSEAREIGQRAQTAATPAITRLHARAERAAQALVDRIDEKLGGRPPMQHVLLGPGRMIVSFTSMVTIRDAQVIIASVQARSLRRLVGYNAYLVLVPPGREAVYAERLQAYREIVGVHFGSPRQTVAAARERVPSHAATSER